jgi:hypothetical protein
MFVSYRVITNKLSREEAAAIVERKRQKGRGLFRNKQPEERSYLKQLLWPVNHVEIKYSKINGFLTPSANLRKSRLFMLGNCSLPFVENVLLKDGGRRALKLLFTKENRSIFDDSSLFLEAKTKVPVLNAGEVFNRLLRVYSEQKSDLKRKIITTRKDVQPLFDEAANYQEKANQAKENAALLANAKATEQYKEFEQLAREYNNKAKQLKTTANQRIAHAEADLSRVIKKWQRGQRRHLGIRGEVNIESIATLETFYYQYWIARLESKDNIRFLVLNEKGRREKKLETMLHFDASLRAEIDALVAYKKSTNKHSCFYCSQPIDTSNKKCPHCGKEVISCSVCKLPISKNDSIVECPKCHTKAHLAHLFEWLKSKGTCPHCMQKILPDELIKV